MRKCLLLLLSTFLVLSNAYAQDRAVTGIVKDSSDNSPLPGVNVLIKGTNIGSVTDFDGKYILQLSEGQNTLVFSFVGYQSQEVVVNSQSKIDINLQVDAEQLEEVVVTALGIEREERSLGYAVQGVKAEDMGNGAATGNMMNSLSGKVAGVQITPSNGAGSASKVIIRGNAMLGSNNQPLYVIDGVPISNNILADGSDGDESDISTGDGLSSLNPDDIAEMSVLKGGSATALYGSRAINGVILITTKSGKKGSSGVDFSQGFSMDFIGITPNEQSVYGNGSDGRLASDRDQLGMWGPKIEGQLNTAYYDGKERALTHYNNYDDFFRTGLTSNTSVSAYGSTEKGSIRFSYSNMDNRGMVQNSTYKRNTFSIKGDVKLSEKIKVDARLNYTNQKANNRLVMGSSVNSYMSMLIGMPSTISHHWLKDYKDDLGRPIGYTNNDQNPYWYIHERKNEDELNRVVGMTSVTYNVTEDLKILARTGIDYGAMRLNVLDPLYSPWQPQGRAFERTSLEMESNSDFLISYNKKVGKFDVNVNAGGAYLHQIRNFTDVGSSKFSSSDFQNPGAGSDVFQDFSTYEMMMTSLYATASVGYNGYLYLDASVRNDWASTLPINNNSFLYPSISGTWVFSDMDWSVPEWLSFGKLRASWAQVGSHTDPYSLYLQYDIDNWDHNGLNFGNIKGNDIPNANLKPAIQTSYEFGMDLRLFNDKLGIDVARYSSSSVNQIIPVSISDVSGYDRAIINAGEIVNRGWEFAMDFKAIDKGNFKWTTALNAAYNYNEVVSLTEGVDFYEIASAGGISIQANPGQAYGALVAKKALRTPEGGFVVDGEGRIMQEDEPSIIGNGVQPWMAGWRNTFNYKNLSLSILIDGKFGGDIYSSTNASMYISGKHENTVAGREEFYNGGAWNPGNLYSAVEGDNGDVTYEKFEGNVDPQQYWGRYGGIAEFNLYDASFIKLREVSVSYMFPKQWMQKTPIKNLSLTASAFNVGYLWKSTPNVDPEASFSSRNVSGVESATLALPRTLNFKLNANF
ncbi:SusC/RagA family TonB-linked outer membrane protein [Flammeovirga sp. EKP202]|uniref:SusC/RagA family TonB-linked outer membrane protein n=1 Tax=Flammeovirga sp. EKP202 TaxID=2770592 RepID=UPI00165FF08A|nr:SusC/RagA family TonB-linked outer membrane protein [Flammeovirga sp. EKP202]MBD0402710.1 SusC/RagA family TonB-linked outer membrane protein [Flammeovirga sp. EKP202]